MAAKPLPKVIRDHYRRIGRKGGRARAKVLTPARRSEIARQGGLANRKKALDSQDFGDDTTGQGGT